jgi:DNA adenine methylase
VNQTQSWLPPVRPVSPVAPYIGGKRRLAGRVIERLAAMPAHTTYAEAFVGMGGVFLRRSFKAQAEVINDISTDVAGLFRVLQRHFPQFMEVMRFQLTTRAEFERLAATDPATLTDLERAARFIYLQRTAFGGKVVGQNFGVSPANPARFDMNRLGTILEAVHDRLASVVIERLPWQAFLVRYDRPETLFYLDPPYYGTEADYGEGVFSPDDFTAMAGLLRGLKGRFLLSLNDVPEVRRLFAGFAIEGVSVDYSISGGGRSKAREVLISNWSPND